MKNYFETALNEFGKKRVVVIGDIMLDWFVGGEERSLNPESKVPKINVFSQSYSLGGASNVANNIISMGAECKLIGFVGNDLNGNIIKEMCKKTGITFYSYLKKGQTIVKQRVMVKGEQIIRIDYEEEEKEETSERNRIKIMNKLENCLKKVDFVILSDYNKGFFTKDLSKDILNLTRKYNISTVVDAKPQNVYYFEGATIIRPNKHEASKMTGIKYSKEKLPEIGKTLREIVKTDYAVITCGKDGAFCYNGHTGEYQMVKTQASKVGSTAGAGDTFAAALTLGMSAGLDLMDASRLANYASGVVVDKEGVATASRKEIRDKISSNSKI